MNYKSLLLCTALTLGFVACNNDDSTAKTEEQSTAKVTTFSEVNASDYSNWTYVNLETGETETHRDFTPWVEEDLQGQKVADIAAVGSLADVKINWHIALRRELVKTNGGAAYLAPENVTTLSQATLDKSQNFRPDTLVTGKARLMMSLAQMMQGKPTYSTADQRNPVLSQGFVKEGQMPSIVYRPTQRVMLLRTQSGEYFKLLFTDFLNNKGVKGYVSFQAERVK